MDSNQTAARHEAELKRKLALKLLSLIGIGILAFALLALLTSLSSGWLAAIGIGGMIFLASSSVGGAFGFLFAVPRVLTQDDSIGDETADTEAATPVARLRARLLRSNTNLERISDWLTTMLVGVGLSQLGSIDPALSRFRDFLVQYANIAPAGKACATGCAGMLPTVGPMVLVFGLVMGFLFLYLYTRLILVSLFNQVEDELAKGGDLDQKLQSEIATKAVVAAAQSLDTNNENPALKGLVSTDDPSVSESLGVMFNMLYQPEKYQDVINLSGTLSVTPAIKTAEYWFLTAAAFGQKYLALKSASGSDQDLQSARDNALDCARRAVDIDASYRARIWNISDPNSIDNDLSAFRSDATFLAITGMQGKT
jgi:hypothetical protein